MPPAPLYTMIEYAVIYCYTQTREYDKGGHLNDQLPRDSEAGQPWAQQDPDCRSMKDTESRDLLEIIEARYKKASTIFCSQFDVLGWREKFDDPIIADAICDRIVHDSYTILIDCKDSMRKRKGISEN